MYGKRYCTGYPKGIHELVEDWRRVTCDKCHRKKKDEDLKRKEFLKNSLKE
jgi:hypothetical protein